MSEQVFTPGDLADELESGKWRKGRLQLGRHGGQRCCLGVACEMAGIDLQERWSKGRSPSGVRFLSAGLPAQLPAEVVDRFERTFPWLGKVLQARLADDNDKWSGWNAVIKRLRELDKGGEG